MVVCLCLAVFGLWLFGVMFMDGSLVISEYRFIGVMESWGFNGTMVLMGVKGGAWCWVVVWQGVLQGDVVDFDCK
jgi:hypothetical protein